MESENSKTQWLIKKYIKLSASNLKEHMIAKTIGPILVLLGKRNYQVG